MKILPLHLRQLVIYRNLLNDPVIKRFHTLLEILSDKEDIPVQAAEEAYFDFVHQLMQAVQTRQITGDVWENYLLQIIIEDENIFSLACEQNRTLSENLLQLAAHDLNILMPLFNLDWAGIKQLIGSSACLPWDKPGLPAGNSNFKICWQEQMNRLGDIWTSKDADTEEKLSALINFYRTNACGIFSRYAAFRWDHGLIGIEHPDPVTFDDLVGYSRQKEVLIGNTQSFVSGKPANNILLYGEKGTGKSSSVKALLNKFSGDGLRMVELTKMQLADFGLVIQTLRNRGQRFIIFIDDLSFEDSEVDYKYIKASLEGSLEVRPENVLIYVTSNRRHLIKENWSDRQRSDEEVHISDSHQEKLSFADRFGISISYFSPDQEQYLNIVEDLAKKSNISIPADELRRLAIQWEINHHGRSGRTARQFITYLSARQ